VLNTLALAWGAQLFEMRMFHADPHPGNICVDWKGLNGKGKGAVGLLDWGQVKFVSDQLAVDFAHMVEAINSKQEALIVAALAKLGQVSFLCPPRAEAQSVF
jgi:predicted unusual protein kinase regulating ubiquinone biosynthesis (AarF/ABC1/UbiB family)